MYIVTQLIDNCFDAHHNLFMCDSFDEAMKLAEDIAKQTVESEPYANTSGKAHILRLEQTITWKEQEEKTFQRRV